MQHYQRLYPDAQPATLRPYVRSAEPDNSFWYLGQMMSAVAEGEDTGEG